MGRGAASIHGGISVKGSGMKKINEGFIIDLDTGTIRCRWCRLPCRSVDLPTFSAFACFSPDCGNPYEMHRYSDGTWKIYGIGVVWGEEDVQAKLLNLLLESPTPEEPK